MFLNAASPLDLTKLLLLDVFEEGWNFLAVPPAAPAPEAAALLVVGSFILNGDGCLIDI